LAKTDSLAFLCALAPLREIVFSRGLRECHIPSKDWRKKAYIGIIPLNEAIYEGGIFRPTEPVQLAEGSKVNIEIPVKPNHDEPRTPEEKAHFDRVYEILSRRFDGGEKDIAERHNEHQP
jgi:predicted DNA-binding antitoxin AbrB/MazE fold protein